MEHKLLSSLWLEFLGSGGRETVTYDVPADGTRGPVPAHWGALPIGKAALRKEGADLTLAAVGVSVHRALEAAAILENRGIRAGVLDLRSVSPLDVPSLCEQVGLSGRLLVVDEDYQGFGLSGEVAAAVLEEGIPFKYARVCTQTTIPYARELEDATLPNVGRILDACKGLLED
jgi:pyruvate dehydrogenase E1 component beta subunit